MTIAGEPASTIHPKAAEPRNGARAESAPMKRIELTGVR